MLVIAHRGNHQVAPENSWAAFESAIAIGSDRIELDLQLSKDNEIFIIHDDDLSHCTKSSGRVSEMTAKELASVRLKNDEPIPRLEDLLKHILPQIELNLEIKGDRPELAEIAAKLVERCSFAHKVIFSSFCVKPLEHLRDNYPLLKRAVLWGYDTFLSAGPHFMAPHLFMNHCQTNIIHPQIDLIDKIFMEQAHRRNWQVFGWAGMKSMEDYKRPVIWQNLKEMGVHGLCTNYPQEMRQYIQARQVV